MRRRVGVARAPALEAGECVLFPLRAPDLDERVLRHAPARRLHTRRLSSLFSVVGRPWGISETVALVTRRQLEEARQGARMEIDAGVPIAHLGEPPRHRREREIARV